VGRKLLIALAVAVTLGGLIAIERASERPARGASPSQTPPSTRTERARSPPVTASTRTSTKAPANPRATTPGYSMALTPFATVGGYPRNVQRGAKAGLAFYFIAAIIAAWALGGPLAAALAGAFVWMSPFAHQSAGLGAVGRVHRRTLCADARPGGRPTGAGTRLAGALSGVAALAA